MLIKFDEENHPEEVILDSQDENTEVDYLCDGTERVIDLSNIPTPTYSNVTLTSGGYNTISSPYVFTTGTGVTSPWTSTNATGELKLDGANADVVVNGKSLGDAIRSLEERLNILVPNPELEKEWAELKSLGEKYRKLEADLTEKARMWQALQKTSK